MHPELIEELRAHLEAPFPSSIENGELYGEVEPVMTDADIHGWASNSRIDPMQRRSLREAADRLTRSLAEFPSDAVPYFERLIRIARRAAAQD